MKRKTLRNKEIERTVGKGDIYQRIPLPDEKGNVEPRGANNPENSG